MEALQREDQRFTYSDYCTWQDNEQWELVDGKAYAMAPAPSLGHQWISSNLHLLLAGFLKGKPCKVFYAPFDVRLNADTNDNTVVQPDLVVICDRAKLADTGCIGAPDMIIEILSPATSRRDRTLKFDLYLQAGVREYWIVDPETKTVSAHILKNGEYTIRAYTDADTAPVHVLEGCTINLAEVFEDW